MLIDFLCCGEVIQNTAAYSNAVLTAVLPYVSDVAKKMELPMPTPVEMRHVERFVPNWRKNVIGGGLLLKGGASFGFENGTVNQFLSPHSYFAQQDPAVVPKFFGPTNMTSEEGIALARSTLKLIGFSLEDTFATFQPVVRGPGHVGTNIIPAIEIQWRRPTGGPSVTMEVNLERKVVESFSISRLPATFRDDPKISVVPQPVGAESPFYGLNEPERSFNPQYAEKLIPFVFDAIEDWNEKLALGLPLKVSTNQVARFYVSDQGGWPHCEVTFTNGWWFRYRNSGLTYAGSPRRFFDSDQLAFHLTNYVGNWSFSEQQAIAIAREAIARLGYPKDFVHTDEAPRVIRPKTIEGMPTIPRLQVEWNYPSLEKRKQWIQVEVDCSRGTVESVYLDDPALWHNPPPIDVPIKRPTTGAATTATNRASEVRFVAPLRLDKNGGHSAPSPSEK